MNDQAKPAEESERPHSNRIRGSTTITELLYRFPDGSAAQLLAKLQVPCAHCGGAPHEPLTLAARRHGRDPGAFLRACQALETGGATEAQIAEARVRIRRERRH
ncbi:MAG: hypothetical protein ACRDNT_25285 [Streptosporangiaceae bacterium]